MHITVECPHCHEQFQVDPALRGKSMRCPVCRKIFDVNSAEVLPEVNEADFAPEPEAAPPLPAVQSSGSVGEVIPLLNAEIAAPRPPQVSAPLPSPEAVEASWAGEVPLPLGQVLDVPAPPAPPNWQQPPPVRKPGTATPPAPPAGEGSGVRSAAPPAAPEPAPDEDTSWLGELPPEEPARPAPEAPLPEGVAVANWAASNGLAPPVRGAVAPVTAASTTAPAPLPPANPPNWPRRILVALVVLAVGSLGAFALVIWFIPPVNDEQQRAEAAYQRGDYADASRKFRELENKNSGELYDFFHFKSGLSDVRASASRRDSIDDTKKARKDLTEFVQGNRGDPRLEKFLDQYREDLLQTSHDLATLLEAEARRKVEEQPADLEKVRDLLSEAGKALAEADAFRRDGPKNEEAEKLRNGLAAVAAAVARHERTNVALDSLKRRLRQEPPLQAVAALRDQLVLESEGVPDLPTHPAVRKLLGEAVRNHRQAVRYTRADAAPPPPVADDPELLTNLLLVPPVGDLVFRAPAREDVIFSLARGVLYALDAETGKPRWATRVGSDAAYLPLWLPRTEKGPSLVLVASADRGLVTAREALTGKPHWRHRMPSPCLGKPLLVDGRLYLPGHDGQIDELDLAGRKLGHFQVGGPLTVGGAHQPGTSLLYFPEDSYTVYVLDVAKKECAGILYSRHDRGSLRCAPVVVNSPDGAGKGHLLLCQTDGVDAMKLRAFPLPIAEPDAPPRQPEMRLAGWTSGPPYLDGETLAVATDAGLLKLLGLKQYLNRDPDFFPLLPQDVTLPGEDPAGSARIAYADGYEFWVLTQGGLHRLRKGFDRQSGPKLVERSGARELGSPLHAGQTDPSHQTLFVTALAPAGHACRTTALDLSNGSVRWRRQLGLVPRLPPLGLGERVLVQDQGGALFLFDAAAIKLGGWVEAGQALIPPEPTARDPGVCLLRSLPTKQGDAAFLLSFKGKGSSTQLQVRRLAPGEKELDKPRTFTLNEGLAGEPGVWADHLVLPLANNILYRRPLNEDKGDAGPNWNSPEAEPGAACYVVPVGATDFLATDGSRGLRYMDWPADTMGVEKKVIQVRRRIVAPPALLPRAKEGAWQVCVADAGGTLTLLEGAELKTVREWPLGGAVTAGPFVRGGGVGCVVEKRRLVWLDPAKEKPAWEHAAGADLVGEPVLIDGLLVVADQSGRVVGLDPKTGRPAGQPFVFAASVSPTAAPLPFGEGRLFVPLSDGTAAVLPLQLLQIDP